MVKSIAVVVCFAITAITVVEVRRQKRLTEELKLRTAWKEEELRQMTECANYFYDVLYKEASEDAASLREKLRAFEAEEE